MGGYMNRVILLGNLTRDPELRYSQNGTAVVSLDMAMNKPPRSGESDAKEQKPIFIRITVWKKQAESCAEFLKKGSQVLIDGELKMNEWTDKENNKRSQIEVTAHNVQFLGGKPKTNEPIQEESGEPEPANQDEQ